MGNLILLNLVPGSPLASSLNSLARGYIPAALGGSKPVYTGGELTPQRVVVSNAISTIAFSSKFSNSPTSYAYAGEIPPGTSFNTSTGDLTGTPTKHGAYIFDVTATNASGWALSYQQRIYVARSANYYHGANFAYDGGTTGDYFVRTTANGGSDSNAGTTYGAAYATIEKAFQSASSAGGGKVILVDDGEFHEDIQLASLDGWSTVTLKPYGTARPVIDGSVAVEDIATISACTVSDADYLGDAWDGAYKFTIPSGTISGSAALSAMNLIENGKPVNLAYDRASDNDPFAIKLETDWHTADSWTLDGSSHPLTITDTSVLDSSVYTEAQLQNAFIVYFGSGNEAVSGTIDAFDGTDTIDVTGGAAVRSSDVKRYEIVNSGPKIKEGRGRFVYRSAAEMDGSRVVYIYPHDPANMTNGKLRLATNTYAIDTYSVSGVIVEGMTLRNFVGNSSATGIAIGNVTSLSSSGVDTNVQVRHCDIYNLSFAVDSIGYGGVYIAGCDDSVIESNTVWNCRNGSAIQTTYNDDLVITKNDIYNATETPVRMFGNSTSYVSERNEFSYNRLKKTGRGAHANKIAQYLNMDYVLTFNNEWEDGFGYATWQFASNIFWGGNIIPSNNRPELAAVGGFSGTTDNRALIDQNGSSVYDTTGDIILWNNLSTPDRTSLSEDGKSCWVVNPPYNSGMTNYIYNNIFHGLSHNTGSQTVNEGNNVSSDTPGANGITLDSTSDLVSDITTLYTDASTGDYSYVSSGAAGLVGKDMTRLIEDVMQPQFPNVDFFKDINGDDIDRFHVGPFYPGFEDADTEPRAFRDSYWSLATSSTAGAVDITISTLPFNGGSAITDIEYSTNSGSTWQSVGGTTTGTYAVTTNVTAGASNDLLLRAVNAVGNSDVTATKSATAAAASDVTAPTLSSPTDAANGATASTASVSTDEGNGTLYWVVTTSATAPTAAQVKLGQDNSSVAATASGSQSVSVTGVQTISPAPTGLTASTAYTTHFMHEDTATNQSTVSTATGFTTAAASTEMYVNLPTGAYYDFASNTEGAMTNTQYFFFATTFKASSISNNRILSHQSNGTYLDIYTAGKAVLKDGTNTRQINLWPSVLAAGTEYSIMIWATPTDFKCWMGVVGGAAGAQHNISSYADSGFNLLYPELVNTTNNAGTGSISKDIRGFFFMANAIPSAASDQALWDLFFDSNNDPKAITATVGSVTAHHFVGGTDNAATWNALAGKLGVAATDI